jgi:hypothetical protein
VRKWILGCPDCALLAVHLGSGAQIVIFLAMKSVSLCWISLALQSLLVVLHVSCSSPIGVPAFASEVAKSASQKSLFSPEDRVRFPVLDKSRA